MSEKKLVTVDYHEQKILSTAVHPTKQSRVGWEIMWAYHQVLAMELQSQNRAN